jgi:predicted TIM-barrel fold metal-dependent hydrolase
MVTRREALLVAATGALSPPVNFEVPPHACDCHTHIVGDPKRFPMWAGRTYTPEQAPPGKLAELHRTLRIERVVIVTPSIYGTDNSVTLWGMKARGATARGIAVIDEKTPERDLDAMAAAGFRGIRLNLTIAGQNDPSAARERFQTAAKRVAGRGWHVQMNTSPTVIAGLKDLVLTSPVPVVFDHFGGAEAARGVSQPGLAALLELLRSGKAYVKLSAAYRITKRTQDYADVGPIAHALIEANPDRILWGTDWPHPGFTAPGRRATDITPAIPVDDANLFNQLAAWAPDPAVRRKILVDNPARLYRF